MSCHLRNLRKIGIYVAHDDDSILGIGGTIANYVKRGYDVYVVICSDGRNSHKLVLGFEDSPSVWEVKTKRREEIKEALGILGVPEKRLYFLELTDSEGRTWQNEQSLKTQVMEITKKEKPALIYFHLPDAHADHRAVSKVMLEMLNNWDRGFDPPEAYQFFIWTKDLAKNRSDVDDSQVPETPPNAFNVDIREHLDLKQKALFQMRSQVNVWPYPDWQVQPKPILDKGFIDYFLRGEEIFVRVELSSKAPA